MMVKESGGRCNEEDEGDGGNSSLMFWIDGIFDAPGNEIMAKWLPEPAALDDSLLWLWGMRGRLRTNRRWFMCRAHSVCLAIAGTICGLGFGRSTFHSAWIP